MIDDIDDDDSLLDDLPSSWNTQRIFESNTSNKQEVSFDTNRRSSLAIEEFRMINNVSPSQLMSLFKVSNEEKKSPSLTKKLSTRFRWSKRNDNYQSECDSVPTSPRLPEKFKSHSTRLPSDVNKSPIRLQPFTNHSYNTPSASIISNRRNTISNIAFNKINTPSSIKLRGGVIDSITLLSKSDENFHNDQQIINELFELVEQADLEKLKKLLESYKYLVNSQNELNLTPLDISIMLNHAPMYRLLIQYDAKESKKWSQVESKYEKINEKYKEYENTLNSLRENEKKYLSIQKKCQILKRMKETFEEAERPEPPTNVLLYVTGKNHVTVTFDEPLRNNGALITKYKVEWSIDSEFNRISGEVLLTTTHLKEYQIKNLSNEVLVYVRVSCCNLKGWSEPQLSEPKCCAPSCWREGYAIYEKTLRGLFKLNELCNDMQSSKREIDLKAEKSQTLSTPKEELKTKKTSKSLKKNFINLFTINSTTITTNAITESNDGFNANNNNIFGSCHTFSAICTNTSIKFAKQIKKNNAYLAIVTFDNEKIIVTNDDNYPIIEIDENYQSANTQVDLQFLIKISVNFEDINELKNEMDNTIYTSNIQFKYKLLKTVSYIKGLFKFDELINVYHQPLKDPNGNVFFVIYKKQPTMHVPSNLKAINLIKLISKISTNSESRHYSEIVDKNLQQILDFSQIEKHEKPLTKGLYLAYLKIQSSIDVIKILVSNERPYLLPYTKISNNPNISKDEWKFLKTLNDESKTNFKNIDFKSEKYKLQKRFLKCLIQSFNNLVNLLELDEKEALNLKLYTNEAIEINKDITILLVYPPADQIFSLQNDDISLPQTLPSTPNKRPNKSNLFNYMSVVNFEAIHLQNYSPCFFKTYSKLSIALDIEYNTALQFQREAFSADEIELTKQKLSLIAKYQQRLEEIWKESRWLFEAINVARDRTKQNELSLASLHDYNNKLDQSIIDMKNFTCEASYKSERFKISKIVRIKTNKSLSSISSSTSSTLSSPLLSQSSSLLPLDSQIKELIDDTHMINQNYQRDISDELRLINVNIALKNSLCPAICCPLKPNTTTIDVILHVLDAMRIINGCVTLEQANYIRNYYSLVILLNSRERVLRSDYCIADLKEPWSSGQFFLREARDVLAVLKLDSNQNL